MMVSWLFMSRLPIVLLITAQSLSAQVIGGYGLFGGVISSGGFSSSVSASGGAPSFPSGATHYWQLEEASGTRDDFIGSTDLAATSTTGNAAGKNNNAASFTWNGINFGNLNGTTDISVPSAYTFSGWFKFSDTGANQILRIEGETTGSGIIIGIKYSASADEISFSYQEEGLLTFGITPDTGWHYIAVTASGTTVIIYLDGSSVATDTGATIDFADWGSTVFTAVNSGAMSGTVGLIDEVGFWPEALSPSQISDLYNGGTGLFP
jgi:hypothetical protein